MADTEDEDSKSRFLTGWDEAVDLRPLIHLMVGLALMFVAILAVLIWLFIYATIEPPGLFKVAFCLILPIGMILIFSYFAITGWMEHRFRRGMLQRHYRAHWRPLVSGTVALLEDMDLPARLLIKEGARPLFPRMRSYKEVIEVVGEDIHILFGYHEDEGLTRILLGPGRGSNYRVMDGLKSGLDAIARSYLDDTAKG